MSPPFPVALRARMEKQAKSKPANTQISDGNRDFCSGRHIGYNAAGLMTDIEQTSFSDASRATANGLTRVMILHPIATGISFIAFLLSCGAGVFGSLLAALVSLLAFIVTIVVLICDFVLFGIIKDHVNSSSHDTSGSHANFSVAIWTILVAAICTLLGAVIVFFTCCSARLHKKRRNTTTTKSDYGTATTTTRRRRWF